MGTIVRIGGTTSGAEAYLSEPQVAGPAVLVLHDEFGQLPHVRQRCDALADAGFVGLAPDLYAGEATRDPLVADQLASNIDPQRARATLSTTAAQLRSHPKVRPGRIGAIGFSIGGRLGLLTAATGGLDAVASFYGVPHVADDAAVTCPALLHLAEDDDWDEPEAAERFAASWRARGTPITVRGWPSTRHWFANLDVPARSPGAARASWTETLAFLAGHLRR